MEVALTEEQNFKEGILNMRERVKVCVRVRMCACVSKRERGMLTFKCDCDVAALRGNVQSRWALRIVKSAYVRVCVCLCVNVRMCACTCVCKCSK